jgi:PAS domain S-box-containing protein
MSLRWKIASLFLLLSLIPLGVLGYLDYQIARQALIETTFHHLAATNDQKEAEFNRWLNSNERLIASLARRPQVREYSQKLAMLEPDGENFHSIQASMIEDHFEPTLEEEGGFLDLFLLDPESGLVLASTRPSMEGQYRAEESFFTVGRATTFVQQVAFSFSLGEPVIVISTPVLNESGSLIAVLAGDVDFDEMSAIMSQGGKRAQTEETYIVNTSNFFVTQSRFVPNVALQRAIYTEGVQVCLEGKDGTGDYLDYRGVEVLGAYHWMPMHQMCILTEEDRSDALAPVHQMRTRLTRYGAGVGLLIVLVGLMFARSITQPVKKLVAGANAIGEGNLGYRIEGSSRDEIGQLAAAFNVMAENLHTTLGEKAYGERMLLALSQAVYHIQQAHAANAVYDIIVDAISKFGYHALVFTLSEDQGDLILRRHSIRADLVNRVEALLGINMDGYRREHEPGDFLHEVVRGDEAVFVEELAEVATDVVPSITNSVRRKLVKIMGVGQGILAPMAIEDRRYGLLVVGGRGVSIMDLPAVEIFSRQAAIAVENARLYEETRAWTEELEARVEERSAALLESEAKFRTAFEHAAIGRMIAAPDGCIIQANQASCELLGYTEQEMQEKVWTDLIHPSEHEGQQQLIQRLIEGRNPSYETGVKALHKSDRMLWLHLNIALVRDVEDEPLFFHVDIVDITNSVQAEQDLRRSEARYRYFFDSASISILVEDYSRLVAELEVLKDEGVHDLTAYMDDQPGFLEKAIHWIEVVDANEHALQLFDVESKEALLGPLDALAPSLSLDHLLEEIQALYQGQRFHQAETTITTSSGEPRHILYSVRFPTEPEQFKNVLVSQLDITERKLAQQELIVKDNAIDSSLNAVALLDNEGQVTYVNPSFLEMWGYSQANRVLGRSIDVFWSKDGRENGFRGALRVGQEWFGEMIAEREDGSTFISQVSASPILNPHGEHIGVITSCLDVTELRQIQAQLETHAQELARSNAELEQFAYVASHDLQEPLRMVTSYLQLLERRYEDRLDQDAHEFIDFAVDGARRMKRMINDLLRYSRVNTRGKPFEFTDCEVLLQEVLDDLQFLIRDSKAVVTYDLLPTVLADGSQLHQLFSNLIQNAIKFRGDSPPEIHVGAVREQVCWTFSVQDNGIGIEPQFQDRVFEIFERLHTHQEYEGSGIGLAISSRIVERHGGDIWVDSQPGKGATFYFSIPITEEGK